MKKMFIALVLCSGMLGGLFAETVLFVYDEVNKNSSPYITLFRDELKSAGYTVDETAAAGVSSKNLASYDYILIHGMVMAFASKSPVRDWLKTKPALAGKKVSLLVTANRWYLEKLYKQVTSMLDGLKPVMIDAVSQATKDLDAKGREALVKKQVSGLK